MNKIVLINDLHWGKFSDSVFMLDKQEMFYKNILIPYVLKNDIRHIIILGDLFDKRKVININTLYRAKEMFFDILQAYDITIHIIPGNHDCSYKNTNKINSLTTTLKEYSNVRIYEEPTVVNFGIDISFIPWINAENEEKVINFVNNTKAKILCGHLELSGFDMYRGIPQKHGMDAGIFSKFDKVFTGHYHLKSSRNNIFYLGSQFQFTWSDWNEKKYFHVYDTDTNLLEEVENPYNLYEKIVYNDETEDYNKLDISYLIDKIVEIDVFKKTNLKMFDSFIGKLNEINLIELKIKENFDRILITDEEDLVGDKSTKELIEMYIDESDTIELDKEKLKHLFQTIYNETIQDDI